jgi:uncharacterized protein (TIGR02466 family)
MLDNWFCTPVYYGFASDRQRKEIEQQYFEVESQIKAALQPNSWGDNVSTTAFVEGNLIERYGLTKLKEFILESALEYQRQIHRIPIPLDILGSWANYYSPRNYQNTHDHGNTEISGAYYIKTNTKDGNFRLHPPSTIMGVTKVDGKNLFSYNPVEYTPQEGKLLLFPSWALHSVKANMTDDTRISVAFNLI